MNFQLQDRGPLQGHNPSTEEQDEEGLLTDPTEKRFDLTAVLQALLISHFSTNTGEQIYFVFLAASLSEPKIPQIFAPSNTNSVQY